VSAMNNESNPVLSFENLQIFQQKNRFWTYQSGSSLYIFDQHISHVYQIEDVLKDLILAKDEDAFQTLMSKLTKKEIEENTDFLDGILSIPDEKIKRDYSQTGISTLKLNISSRCNLWCSYCFREKEVDTELADKQLIYKAIDYMVYDCGRDAKGYTVIFEIASEPLLQPELLGEVYKYIKKLKSKTGKRIEIFFITNGTILSEKLIKLIKTVRKDRSISISIDGPKQLHDLQRTYRDGKGSYDQITANLGILRKKKIKYAAEAVISKNNPYPLQILKHLLELGFVSVNIKPIRQGTIFSFDKESLQILKKGYDDYFAYLKEELIVNRNSALLGVVIKDYALRPFWRILLNHKMNLRCMWGVNTISMDYKGDFYPCDSIMGTPDYIVGSVQTGIDWEKFHQDLNCEIRGECGECWARNICAGTCPINSINTNHDLLFIDPIECELTRFLIEKNLVLICELIGNGINLKAIRDILGYDLYQIYLAK